MKKNWIILWALLVLLLNVKSFAQEPSRLKNLRTPVAGENLKIEYVPQGGPLANYPGLAAMIYLFNDYRWVVDDVALTQKNGTWEGSFTLPSNCAFVALKFVAILDGKEVAKDVNNDQGYVFTTVTPKKIAPPGAALAWGVFRKPSLNKAPQGYFDKSEISNEALEMWVRKEMNLNLKHFNKYFDIYLAMLKLKSADTFPKVALRNIEKFSKEPNIDEQGYQSVWEAYSFLLKEKKKADSVREIVLQKYPKGKMARLRAYNDVLAMPLDEKKLIAQDRFLTDFPITDYRKDPSGTQNFIYYNTYRQLAAAYFASSQIDKLFKLTPDMDFETLNEIYRWNIDRIFTLSRLPLERIYPVSSRLINEMLKKQSDGSYTGGQRFTKQQARDFVTLQLDNKLSVHIRLLEKMGKYDEALPYFDFLSDGARYSEAALNEAYVKILENTGSEQMVPAVLERSIRANAATPEMITRLRKIFVANKAATGNFDSYLESLKSPKDVQKKKAALKSKIMSIPYSPFKINQLGGSPVSSSDWKNKIVVIDYWATWCFPCKMAFPGMQLLVDRYSKDNNVEIYFVATMERGPDYETSVKKYIDGSGYRFKVLLDDKNPSTGANDRIFSGMVPVFKSSAIPRKVVLKDGLIRYTSEGYDGSPSGLLDELSYVIELLKAE